MSTEHNHTPGPWFYNNWRFIENSKGLMIAELRPSSLDDNENRANTQLIAAAPDLLAALYELTEAVAGKCNKDGCPVSWDLIDNATNAIEKATGAAP